MVLNPRRLGLIQAKWISDQKKEYHQLLKITIMRLIALTMECAADLKIPNWWSDHREKLRVMKSINYKRPTSLEKKNDCKHHLLIIARARLFLHSFGCIRMIQGTLTPFWLFSRIVWLPLSIRLSSLPLPMHLYLFPYWFMCTLISYLFTH